MIDCLFAWGLSIWISKTDVLSLTCSHLALTTRNSIWQHLATWITKCQLLMLSSEYLITLHLNVNSWFLWSFRNISLPWTRSKKGAKLHEYTLFDTWNGVFWIKCTKATTILHYHLSYGCTFLWLCFVYASQRGNIFIIFIYRMFSSWKKFMEMQKIVSIF